MNGVFNILIKKILDLFGDRLASKLLQGKDTYFERLLELYHHLKMLDPMLYRLTTLTNRERLDFDEFAHCLAQIQMKLTEITNTVGSLGPGIDIYAKEAANEMKEMNEMEYYIFGAVEKVRGDAEWPTNDWALKLEPPIDWPNVLQDVRQKAQAAKDRIGEFIKENYTWQKFSELYRDK